MRNSAIMVLLAATVVLGGFGPAWADDAPPPITLTARSEVERMVVRDDGTRELVRVNAAEAKVVPEDVVIFTIGYEYSGVEPATGVVINNPVPEHTIYRFGSAEGQGTAITFSVDGGKTFARGEDLYVVKDGVTVPASSSDYTHIRWIFTRALTKGDKGEVSFRAIVE